DVVPETRVTVHAARVAATWGVHARELGLDDTPGAPWLLLPPPARRAFEIVRAAGTPFAASHVGAPLLGVKCGCNGAVIVRVDESSIVAAESGNVLDIERDLLRPLIRGENVT